MIADFDAEYQLAGLAALTQGGARVANEVVADLHDPRARRVILAGVDTPVAVRLVGDERVDYVAGLAGQPRALVRAWAASAVCLYDVSGALRSRVRQAAADRRRAAELEEELVALTGRRVHFGTAA